MHVCVQNPAEQSSPASLHQQLLPTVRLSYIRAKEAAHTALATCSTRHNLGTLGAVRLCRVVWENETQQHPQLVKSRLGQMSMNGSNHGSAYTQTEKAQDNGRRPASPLRSPSFQGHDPVSLRRIEAEVSQHVARRI